MTDPQHASRDLEWYRSRWETLRTVLDLDDPDEVVPRVRELQLDMLQGDPVDERVPEEDRMSDERRELVDHLYNRLQTLRQSNECLRAIEATLGVDAPAAAVDAVDDLQDRVSHLEAQQEALDEAGLTAEQAVQMVATMQTQLDALYREKEFAESASLEEGGDTFEQLQALLAREEKLKRELGVSSIDQVIEMVEGMSEQLSVLYENIENASEVPSVPAETVPAETMPAETVSANGSADASANGAAVSPGALNRLQEELGVQDPDDIIAMVNSLTRQLEDLYSARERLAEANITDEESVVAMVNNMQHQLESLYETQERMSQKGVKNVDNALSMIENMDAQLEALYEERESASPADLNAMRERLDQTMSELEALKEEKRRVVRERDALRRATLSPDASAPDAPDIEAPPAKDDGERREPSVPPPSTASRLETLEQNFGSRDPEQIAELIHSMEEQLGDRPAAEMKKAASQILDSFRAVVGEDVLAHLEEMSVQELDELEVGVLRLDDAGRIEQANEAALQFPGCTAEVPEALEGVNFFFDLAPSANNALFRGRFVKGVHNGSLDANFPYTFIRPEAPPVNLVVKLHRKPTEESNWILFSRL